MLYDALAQPNVIITINLDSEKHVEFIINCENVKETDKQTPFSLQKIGYKILFFSAYMLLLFTTFTSFCSQFLTQRIF